MICHTLIIDGLILRSTSNIGKIKVNHSKRSEGKSGYTFSKRVSLWLNIFTNFSILPLRIAVFQGFIFAFNILLYSCSYGNVRHVKIQTPIGTVYYDLCFLRIN